MTETQRPPFDSSLNEQRTEATIEIEGAKFVVTAEQLEIAIAHLGALRSQMLPPVPDTPNQDRMLPLEAPSIRRMGATTERGAMLQVRSSYFGWFEVYLTAEWCAGLVSFLQGADASPPKSDSTSH